MMVFNKLNILIVALLLLCSCSKIKTKQVNEKPIARVYDKYLYPSDVLYADNNITSYADSAQFTDAYIGVWIKNQLMLHKAESNLTEKDLDIDKLIENYKQSLVIFTYEQKVIGQILDTIVTELDIESYYTNNKSNFKLNQNIIKVSYVVAKHNAVETTFNIRKWLTSETDEDEQKLIDFCERNNMDYYVGENNWIHHNDIVAEIPIDNYNKSSFVSGKKYLQLKDAEYEYFVFVKDFMSEGEISPLDLVKSNIVNIIINIRKKTLLQQIENDLYKTALKNNAVEIY